MAMDGFVSAFHQVDVDDDGIINEDDLNHYCEENNLKRNFTEKWLSLFDHDNDKIIHYEEFCRALGIESKRRYSNASAGNDDIVVFKETDMSNATKDAIIRKIYRKGKHEYNLKEDNIKDIIEELNMDHGPNWNVIVNPTEKEVKCCYDFDGKLYYSPNVKGKNKLLVWRIEEKKKKGLACCCC